MNGLVKVKSYSYYMMGMNIFSEIELPGIVRHAEHFDVNIILNKVDMGSHVIQEEKNYYFMKENEFVCDINNTAKFKITGGNLIQIELYEQADMELVTVYLLGTCMGVLLLQKGMVAMHGSTIVIDQQAIIITGQCGAGKSTLSTALRLRGYPLLSDDISPIMIPDCGTIMSAPAFPKQRICHDTAVMLGIDTKHLDKACSEDFKYSLDIREMFLDHPVELFGIIQVQPGDVEEASLTELTRFEKVELIKSNIFCKEFYSRADFRPSYFKKILDLANNIHTYRLIRPEGKFTVDRQIDLILNEITRATGIRALA